MTRPEEAHGAGPELEPDTGALSRAIVETVRAPLVVLDGSLVVLSANPAFYATFRLASEDVLDRPLLELGGGQWDVPELRALLERVLPEHSEVLDFRLRANLPGAGVRILMLNARQLELGGEGRSRILLSVEDVTERDASRRRIRRYARELERSNRELESFAHAASHDLQEPLRKIRTYAERLPEALGAGDLGERAERYLLRLGEAAERMESRVEDLLRLARIGRTPPTLETTPLGQVVDEVLEDLSLALEEAGGRVEVGELPVLEVDPSQMRILFQNLLANALKFRGKGAEASVRIREEVVDEDLGEGKDAASEMCRIVVEDEGIGFEQAYAERIFEPFQRLHGRAEFEGSGVGLALCRRIVEHHAGSIVAEGRPGEGSRFIIHLPARRPDMEIPS